MRFYRRLREFDDRMSDSVRLRQVKKWIDGFMPFALVALITVLYFEFFVHLSHTGELIVLRVEQVLLAYFVLELGVDFLIYRDNKQFFKDKWLDIVLILPFLTVIRGANGLFRILLPTKKLKVMKAAKSAKPVKVGKTAKGITVAQKGGKVIHKGRKVLKFLRRLR